MTPSSGIKGYTLTDINLLGREDFIPSNSLAFGCEHVVGVDRILQSVTPVISRSPIEMHIGANHVLESLDKPLNKILCMLIGRAIEQVGSGF
jgi:hypothetical protein